MATIEPTQKSESATLVEDLECLLDELGIRITRDRRVEGRGGLCTVHGERRLILNSRLPTSDEAEVILEELAHLDLSGVYLAPALRDLIEA